MLGPLILFAAAMAFTPGPNTIMVTAGAANFGFRRIIPQIAGITIGFGTMVAVVGIGFAGLVKALPQIHEILKYVGAAYLLYLAWRIARASGPKSDPAAARPFSFLEGALFQFVNVKGWVAAIGGFAAFTTAGGNLTAEVALITAVFTVNCLAALLLWAGFGTVIGRFLGSPRARTIFNYAMAGLLVLSLIPVFW